MKTWITTTLALAALFAAPVCADDQAEMMLKTMKGQPTQYMVALPPSPKVGMWWEHTASGTKMKYSITATKDDKLIVEQEQDLGGTVLVNAWLVDPSVDLKAELKDGEKVTHNVSKAWIGIKGKAAHERKVMDVPVYTKPKAESKKVEYTEGDESIELAGKTWNAHWTESGESKAWMVKGTSFLLKSVYQGKISMELTAMGDDAKSQLTWGE